MRDLETLNAQPQSRDTIDIESFWETLEPFLKEKGQEPLDYIRETLQGSDEAIWEMPESLFDPLGGEASDLRKTHVLLTLIVDETERGYAPAVAREIFPYWLKELKDAQEWLGTI